MFVWLRRLKDRWKPITASVEFNDTEVISHRSNCVDEVVTWTELEAVWIETNAGGPWVEDTYLMMQGHGRGCVVPMEAVGFDALLKRLQELPGFDNLAVGHAMCSTDNATFPLWQWGKVPTS